MQVKDVAIDVHLMGVVEKAVVAGEAQPNRFATGVGLHLGV